MLALAIFVLHSAYGDYYTAWRAERAIRAMYTRDGTYVVSVDMRPLETPEPNGVMMRGVLVLKTPVGLDVPLKCHGTEESVECAP